MTNLPITNDFAITACYGEVNNKLWSTYHKGIDIVATDKRIYSTCYGTVKVTAFDDSGWGEYISIHDNEGNRHIFCHLAKGSTRVKTGDYVTPLTIIGCMGSTGNVTGVHLHFQINDKYNNDIDPTTVINIPNKRGHYNTNDFKGGVTGMLKDIQNASEWAKDSIEYVYKNDIMVGNNGYFRPKENITREEIAVIIHKMLQK